MKNITKNQKIIVVGILAILGLFCFYKWSDALKNHTSDTTTPKTSASTMTASVALNDSTDIANDDSDEPASEYIPTTSSSLSKYTINDNALLGLTAVSPDKGFKTGIKEYPILTWKTNNIVEKKGRIYIDVEYPHFFGGGNVTKLNEYVESYVQKTIQDDRDELRDAVSNDPDSYLSSLDLSMVYRLIGATSGIVSLEMVKTDYTGGGNGNHDTPVIINWDLKKNTLLKTSDLFCSLDYLSTIMPLARDRLLVDIKNNPNVEVDFEMAKPIIEEKTMDSSNYEDIIPYKNGIIVVFSPYTILSGVFGILRVYIPDVSNILCLP
jgi:hypothetical protein